ncbi:ankyrin repeat-containing protein BDA1-like [Nymphaea colorata]|uniref:ankyrin repeat-containing protein BDA1-like n=1 Tax=Nymphaea colorata TaxID=210225 RepID=UPI00129DA66D|nr:ankyrin repeat-containing protein BDA1-like [Nymphaea colorata]
MDRRVYRCAAEGDTGALLELVKEDKLILEKVPVDCEKTPLHIAAKWGHVGFAKLVLERMPAFAKIIDQKGRSSLHLASARDHAEIVREILKVDADLCLLGDKDGRNPLHVAAIRGFIQVAEEILAANPRCLQEVTPQGETVLHMTVRNNRVELLRYLLGREDIDGLVNKRDNHGNTILDVASKSNNSEIMNILVSSQKVPEAGNSSGTVLPDDSPRKSMDMETHSHVSSSEGVSDWTQSSSPEKRRRSFASKAAGNHSKKKEKEGLSEIKRGAIMVVSVLIVMLTYQAALSAPGVFSQDDTNGSDDSNTVPAPPGDEAVDSAEDEIFFERSIYLQLFLMANAVGLFASLVIILLLTGAISVRRQRMLRLLMLNIWISVSSVAASFIFGLLIIGEELEGTLVPDCLLALLLICMGFFMISNTVICLRKLLGWIRRKLSHRETV